MQSALPGLVVDVEARIDKLEKALARANRAQSRASDQMERRARQSADRMGTSFGSGADKIAASFSRLASRAGPAIGVIAAAGAGAVATLDKVAKSIAETGDMAKRAGVDFESFQRLEYVATQNRVGVDALTDGLKELSLRADEFILTGNGSGAEAFRRLGYSAQELKRKLKDPSELFLEIVGRLEDMDDAARIRIADEIFGGTGGEQFVQLLGRGEANLRATANRAEELGLVLDDEVLERAEAVNRKFEEIKARVATLGKSVVVNVAGALQEALTIDIDEIFGSAERAISMLGQESYDALKDAPAVLEEQRDNVDALIATYDGLFRAINAATGPDGIRLMDHADVAEAHELAGVLSDIGREVLAFQKGEISAEEFADRMIELTAEAEDVAEELAAIDGVRFANVISAIGGISKALSDAIGKAATLGSALPGEGPIETLPTGPQNGRRPAVTIRPSALAPTKSLRPQLPSVNHSFGVPDPDPTSPGGGSDRASEYEREVQKIRELVQELDLEAAALLAVAAAGGDLSAAIDDAAMKADLLAKALRSGAQDGPALRAEIDALVAAHRAAADAADQTRDKLEETQAARERLTATAEDAFVGLITGTMSWKGALQQVLAELAKLAASRLFRSILGGATGGGIFDGLFSLLGFADGGWTGPGGKYEPAGIVHRGEFVMSKQATEAIGVQNLEALHSAAQRGYSSGGYVGSTPALSASPGRLSARLAAPSVSINAPVTVNGSAGTPDQNTDLAKRMAREMEQSMRGVVVTEIQRAMRPGAILNRG
ncbi:phage tail tape measure protein [Mameliella sp. AT18]|uniref:phage tail tape measure protein n=1 Tax=Mameliella sp. AT18 TaxID=3028385 RepID=UPI00237A0E01|nr:phage tail tape measure protein [Mameliella sp. AT18]MDD9730446.1 phage tail tape measure protein [Mameliella sp. AT18]